MNTTDPRTLAPFTPDTPLARGMAQGHLIRKGHRLTGYYAPTADAGIVRLVRTCCGEVTA